MQHFSHKPSIGWRLDVWNTSEYAGQPDLLNSHWQSDKVLVFPVPDKQGCVFLARPVKCIDNLKQQKTHCCFEHWDIPRTTITKRLETWMAGQVCKKSEITKHSVLTGWKMDSWELWEIRSLTWTSLLSIKKYLWWQDTLLHSNTVIPLVLGLLGKALVAEWLQGWFLCDRNFHHVWWSQWELDPRETHHWQRLSPPASVIAPRGYDV